MTEPYKHASNTRHIACLIRVVVSVSICILMQACATPADNLNLLAQEQGFARSSIPAAGYNLLVYHNQILPDLKRVRDDQSSSILHVYLEGDGSPWRYRTIVMPDPTPRSPLMLRLMALDHQQATYLGRPCYNGSAQDPNCDSRLWTSGRYSEKIIASMASGIRVLARRHDADDIRLFGHSGGGALAMLLAEQIPQVSHVVTIAGNLDTDAWTRHHGYTPLFSSLNPARQTPLRADVSQWHLIGGRDAVIPPQLVRPFIMSQPEASGYLLNGYDHGCCWRNVWPAILSALEQGSADTVPGQRFKVSAQSTSVQENQ